MSIPDSRWRLPALEEYGAQLADLDVEAPGRTPHRPRRRRPVGLTAIALAAVALVLALASAGGPAGASSIVNRAPAAAVNSDSTRFVSVIGVGLRGGVKRRFQQAGAIDFKTEEYQTLLRTTGSAASVEWRSIAGTLYLTEPGSSRHPQAQGWIAVKLSKAERRSLASAPESDALTDPRALLRVLAHTRAPVAHLGGADIDGVPTQRYRLLTNVAAMLRASTGAPPPAGAGQTAAVVDVWLDAKTRPRQVSETLTRRSGGSTAELTATITFTSFGGDVRLTVPGDARAAGRLRPGSAQPLLGGPTRIFQRLAAGAERGG
jgi:hypothetical protein